MKCQFADESRFVPDHPDEGPDDEHIVGIDICIEDHSRPLSNPEKGAQDPEQCRLARSVQATDPHDVTGFEYEVDISKDRFAT